MRIRTDTHDPLMRERATGEERRGRRISDGISEGKYCLSLQNLQPGREETGFHCMSPNEKRRVEIFSGDWGGARRRQTKNIARGGNG